MRKNLQSLYINSDTSCIELAKTALSQLIVKIIYSYDVPLKLKELKQEVNGILGVKFNDEKIIEVIEILYKDRKIEDPSIEYKLTASTKRKFDIAYQEYCARQQRIIKKYFSNAQSEDSQIINWFENVTITFFTEYRTEWISEKAYKVKAKNAYDGLENVVKKITNKDQNIKTEDREWLVSQYLLFFKSNDPDLDSVFWDYGTSAYSSSLITATNSANQITVEALRNSKLILDTNILMYLTLESGKYYQSYESLGNIFYQLDIKPIYFHITRDEYVRSMSNKKEQVINVINKYDDDVLEDLDDAFIKTARKRQCKTDEEYNDFFDNLLDPPSEFIEGYQITDFDNTEIHKVIIEGTQDEDLIAKLGSLFKERFNHPSAIRQTSNNENKNNGKSRKPLEHDAGIIRGTEFLREKKEKCFILTREYSVKRYGVITSVRDEPPISIGLDALISMLAINSGGINLDPNNFKPLFAKIIKLALFPEKGSIQTADLARMLDIEQNIAELPHDDVISLAKDMHKLQLSELEDSKITVEMLRRFQTSKMSLKKDVVIAEATIVVEQQQKEKYKESSKVNEKALKKQIKKEVIEQNIKWLKSNKLTYFFILPLLTIGLTYLILFLNDMTNIEFWLQQVIAISIELIGWLLGNLFVTLPKLNKKYLTKESNIDSIVEERLIIAIKNAT
jgi:hypothetical protein